MLDGKVVDGMVIIYRAVKSLGRKKSKFEFEK